MMLPMDKKLQSYSLRDAPGHLIRRCQQRAVDLFVDEVGENGPNPRQFAVLINVYQNPGMSQTTLVEASGIDRSTLTEVLRLMIKRDMISKSRTQKDRRANALFLTPNGQKILENAFEATERAQKKILSPLDTSARAQAMGILTALANHDYESNGNT